VGLAAPESPHQGFAQTAGGFRQVLSELRAIRVERTVQKRETNERGTINNN